MKTSLRLGESDAPSKGSGRDRTYIGSKPAYIVRYWALGI
jgi:hypothetical protein